MAEEQLQISDLNFEQALRELESVVRRLESGDVPLDESIDLYERGEQLRKACQSTRLRRTMRASSSPWVSL